MSSAPDWSLLPDNPVEFFGLPDDFDRVALKRKYNALLREFKPEKFPAEFQKLRAAYDSLESALRYGQGVAKRPQAAAEDVAALMREAEEALKPKARPVEPPPSDRSPERAPERPSRPVPRPPASRPEQSPQREPSRSKTREADPTRELVTLLASHPVPVVYKMWQDRPNKTAYDYYALALLGDSTDKTPATFVRWLLTGVAQLDGAGRGRRTNWNPEVDALWDLLRAWFGQATEPGVIAGALRFASNHVPGDRFYWLTESAWLRLARMVPFEKWNGLLQECEQKITDHRIDHRLEFYLRVFRVVCWTATPEWSATAKTFIDESMIELDRNEGVDTFQFDLLCQYLTTRAEFLNGNPLHQRLDDAIKGYFQAEEHEAAERVVECNHWIADHSDEVLEATPPGGKSHPSVWRLWERITDDVVDEWGNVASRWEVSDIVSYIHNWGVRVGAKSASQPTARLARYSTIIGGSGLVVGLIAIIGRLGVLAYQGAAAGEWGSFGLEVLLALLLIPPYFWLAIRIAKGSRESMYRHFTRHELVKLLRMVPAAHVYFSLAFKVFRDQKIEFASDRPFESILQQFDDDTGLEMFKIAQTMVHAEELLLSSDDEQSLTADLVRYRGIRRNFVDGSPTRRVVNHVLTGYLGQSEPERAKAFAEAQFWMAANPAVVARDLPAELTDGELLVSLWKKLHAKYNNSRPPVNQSMAYMRSARIDQLAMRLASAESNSIWSVAVVGLMMIAAALAFILIVGGIIIWTIRVAASEGLMQGFPWWLGSLTVMFWLGALVLVLNRLNNRARSNQYATSLRRETFMFCSAEAVSSEELTAIIRSLENRPSHGEKFENVDTLVSQVDQDVGLAIYQLARQFGSVAM